MKKQTAIFTLIIVTIIWGGGFSAVRMSLDLGVTVGLTNVIRGFIFTLMVFICFPKQILSMKWKHMKLGLLAGLFNAGSFIFQTIGAEHTTLSNNAFLTTTNVVMTPFLAWIMLGNKPKKKNFIAVAICMLGTAVLAGIFQNTISFNIGDLFTLLCALCYAISIVLLSVQASDSHFASSAFMMGLTHFLSGLVYFVVTEKAYVPQIDWKLAVLPLLYLGVASSFLAQTMQVAAQKYLTPSTASLVMMLESIWGSLFSIMFGFENFTLNLLIGGGLIVASLIVSEVSFPLKNKVVSKQAVASQKI